MSVAELRTKSAKELNIELQETRREQFNLRIQHKTGQAIASHKIGLIRKKIAQIKTLIAEKEKGN